VGFEAAWTADGERGLKAAKSGEYDLVLLDVLLPGKNGWEVLRELREARINVPILMLTAMDEVGDRVKGLDLGADDYLPKPFEPLELVARIRALLRRNQSHKAQTIRIQDLELDRAARLVSRGGTPIRLTRREYDLLEALAVNEGRVLSRETIQERVWNDADALSNVVDVYIRSLRKKVDAPYEKKLIHTEVGFGYVLKAE
jgi:two-component system, OmpR family, copper resistance phosphate regulon response regulator CusR